jgi:GTP-binding protein
MYTTESIRNIAIIAHVDHGKTTLVDALLHQSGTFRDNEVVATRVMDSNDLEKERGITILAKCTAIKYHSELDGKDYKINIVDTPGHADFGGEVERILNMVDGAILLVDASEGPLPQTRFVLKKALALGLRPIVLVNKIDRPDARIEEVVNEVFDLFVALEASDEQLDFPILYACGRDGWATKDVAVKTDNLDVIKDLVVSHINSPAVDVKSAFTFCGSIIEKDKFVGKTFTGRCNGVGKINQNVKVISRKGDLVESGKITRMQSFLGVNREVISECVPGDIITVSGLEKASISDTICDESITSPVVTPPIDPPTISMNFGVNKSPLAARDGSKLTSTVIGDRLFAESETNVSIRVKRTQDPDVFEVSGRGELQLAILAENMRREGFEFELAKPRVIMRKNKNGNLFEPFEIAVIDVSDEYSGIVVEKLGKRKGIMINMAPAGIGRTRIEFSVPSRGLIGYTNEFLTDTRGTGLLNRMYDEYKDYSGEISSYRNGGLISTDEGVAVEYAIFKLEDRGKFFILPGDDVYTGMIVGEHNRSNDLPVNVTKTKQLTNVRASGSDESTKLTPVTKPTLEQAIEFIADDELVEVTPKSIRISKSERDEGLRKRSSKKVEAIIEYID